MDKEKGMSTNFFEALHQIAADKGITREMIEEIVESAMMSAYKKQFGQNDQVHVTFDRKKNNVLLVSKKMVVRKPQNKAEEVAYEDIAKKFPNAELGDYVEVEEDPFEIFGRIAVQTARQVILQKIKETEKQLIYTEFKDREGELINGEVLRKSGNTLFIKLGRTEGVMPRKEQSPFEHFKVGERIKAVIEEVQKSTKGPSVVLSRASTKFVERLFEIEIPEIYDGIVKIVDIVREPGMRTKVAVTSDREDIDSVGACVGMKGIRIQSIVRELEGEKIDVVEYSSNHKNMAANALTPSRIREIIEKKDGNVIAIVENDQYRLAIGKNGHNARLASRLCGFEIDVKSEDEYREFLSSGESRAIMDQLFSGANEEATSLEELPGMEPRIISLLEAGGIFSVEDLVEKTKEELMQIDGIGEAIATKIIKIVEENVDLDDEEEENEE